MEPAPAPETIDALLAVARDPGPVAGRIRAALEAAILARAAGDGVRTTRALLYRALALRALDTVEEVVEGLIFLREAQRNARAARVPADLEAEIAAALAEFQGRLDT